MRRRSVGPLTMLDYDCVPRLALPMELHTRAASRSRPRAAQAAAPADALARDLIGHRRFGAVASSLHAAQEPRDLRYRDRLAHEVALPLVAALPAQKFHLLGGLDALGDDFELKFARHGDDGGADRGVISARVQVLDERTVDFQSVYR